MRIFHFLITTLFFFSSSRDIIKTLPYNIYQIEDMNQYETKYLPEGNKFYIKLPKIIEKDTTFYLTIPKNITLFPIYSSEFKENPKNEEIINTDYKNEIELKNKENEEYSKYSFNIEKSNSYKVLYFQNNEALNYLSFFASNSNETMKHNETLNYKLKYEYELNESDVFYFQIKIDPDDEDLIIEIEAYFDYYYHPNLQLGYHFFNNPNYTDLINPDLYGNEPYDSKNYATYEYRKYSLKNNNKYQYLGVSLTNKNNVTQKFSIIIKPESKLPTWAAILIGIGIVIFSFITYCISKAKKWGELGSCLILFLCICCTKKR